MVSLSPVEFPICLLICGAQRRDMLSHSNFARAAWKAAKDESVYVSLKMKSLSIPAISRHPRVTPAPGSAAIYLALSVPLGRSA